MESQIWQPYKDQGVILFGIAVDEPQSVVEDFVREFQLTYPVLLGTNELKNQYNIAGSHVSPYPRDYIIGKDGLIAYAADRFDPEAMLEVIENELNLTSVQEEAGSSAPQGFALLPAYPNPVSATRDLADDNVVAIVYRLNKTAEVHLQIYDVRGRLVRTLEQTVQSAGEYTVRWNGKVREAGTVASGIYFIRLEADGIQKTQRMTIVR